MIKSIYWPSDLRTKTNQNKRQKMLNCFKNRVPSSEFRNVFKYLKYLCQEQ